MYRTKGLFLPRIEEFEVVKETPSFVTYKDQSGRIDREGKDTTYCKWHDTFELAKEHLRRRAQMDIEALKYQLSDAELRLKNIQNIDTFKTP